MPDLLKITTCKISLYAVALLFALPLSSQNCEIPPIIDDSYANDIAYLAFLANTGGDGSGHPIIIPEAWQTPFREAFAGLYYAADTLPEADTVLNIYCIHDFTAEFQRISVEVDTSYDWVKTWRELDTLTGSPEFNMLIENYDLNASFFDFIQYGTIITSYFLNTDALIDSIVLIDGVIGAEASTADGDGNEISFPNPGGQDQLRFHAKWGDCPAGCTGERVYDFSYDGCNIAFLGAETVRSFGGQPFPVNCNITSSVDDISKRTPFTLYPNPASTQVNLTLATKYRSGHRVLYRVYDLSGTELLSGNIIPHVTNTLIDLTAIPSGAYLVSVMIDGNRAGSRILIVME